MALSLRGVLIVPYVALVLALAATIGWLSYATGRDAVGAMIESRLLETSVRIRQAVERRVVGASAALDAAFPRSERAPKSIERSLPELRTRFWIAATLNGDANDGVFYGDRNGNFLGLWREAADKGELHVRHNTEVETVYRVSGFRGGEDSGLVKVSHYDPRLRPWYLIAQTSDHDLWAPLYGDFRTREPVATRVRRIRDDEGRYEGVAAVSVSMRTLNDFVHHQQVSSHGIALIMEPDGGLIASSSGPNMTPRADGSHARINVAENRNPLVAHLYAEVRAALANDERARLPRTLAFDGPRGEPVFAAFDRIEDDAGLDWIVVVAAPRSDFMASVRGNVLQTGLAALAAAALAVLIGFGIIEWVTHDLRRLSEAARSIGAGEFSGSVGIHRRDEIGDLARGLEAMQQRLRTDLLTGLANRDALMRRIDGEIARRSHGAAELRPFGLLFVDLDRFKQVNDTYGHEAGDRVLVETARRLEAITRPSDLVARHAGDEFVVFVADGSNLNALYCLSWRIKRALLEPLELPGGMTVTCAASLGLAIFPADGRDSAGLLKRADLQMYRNKFDGRT